MLGITKVISVRIVKLWLLTAAIFASSHTFAALGDIDTFFRYIERLPGQSECDPVTGFCFQQGPDGDAALTGTSVSGSSVTLGPNYGLYAPDAFWDNGSGMGNKTVITSSFGEQVGVPVGTGVVGISGYVDSFTLVPGYTVQAFIKVLDPGAGFIDLLGSRTTLLSEGYFSLSADLGVYEGDTSLIIQTGFEVAGLNGTPTSAATDGSVSLRLGASRRLPGAAPPAPVPALPLWGLLGLVGLIGFLGLRRRA